jgi:glycosyltransferase involved in cell wall biosynthesis
MTSNGRARVCLVAEEMAGPLDEGTRKFAHSMAYGLKEHCEVRGLSVGGGFSSNGIISLPQSKTFLLRGLRDQIERFQPDIVCYVPSASMTVFAFMRAWILKSYAPAAKTALVLLQPRRHTLPGRKVLSLFQPDLVLTQSERMRLYARDLGCRVAVLPPAVDLERFRPATPEERCALREKHSLPREAFIALHVGHAKAGRNVAVLSRLQPGATPVFVAGSSAGADGEIVRQLAMSGVRVIDTYVESIEEVYRASDCYVFPVRSADDAIEVPLSVLEAMACNLPVVSMRFGALPDLFRDGPGLRFVSNDEQLIERVQARDWMSPCETRAMVEPYSWSNAARALLEAALR